MSDSKRFNLLARTRSFGHAFAGLAFMLRTQHNAWLHLAVSVTVIAAGFVLKVTNDDWRWLICAIGLVWMAETFNTAVEYVCDTVSPSYSETVKRAKDIAAGAVLICAMAAAVIGLITLWPYVFVPEPARTVL